MIKIIYKITPEERETELEWLRDQKIFPSCQNSIDWITGKDIVHIGVIVSPDAALAIKLRHNLDSQTEYRQR
jgi:hypothetical protein